ncbi:hypothetical protein EYF80_017307 [Liparis tanakae]|uniref:Uncharacterized protein n=1 Tax=Liparis tanakae TaxID=230148 RepID=A0A4Z2I438_9TELE|nr:hypothetical protein EYF80_017307 [Liparis tanakae]
MPHPRLTETLSRVESMWNVNDCGAGHSEDSAACSSWLLAVMMAAGPEQAEQPTSRACEGEAAPSVCKACFNCD